MTPRPKKKPENIFEYVGFFFRNIFDRLSKLEKPNQPYEKVFLHEDWDLDTYTFPSIEIPFSEHGKIYPRAYIKECQSIYSRGFEPFTYIVDPRTHDIRIKRINSSIGRFEPTEVTIV